MEDHVIKCRRCDGRRGVCQAHEFTPFDGPTACGCDGAGKQCPDCNPEYELGPPMLPPDIVIDAEEE